MALAIDSPRPDDQELGLSWSGRLSLTARILAVNIFALALLAGSFFYLDSFRARLIDERLSQAGSEAGLVASVVERTAPADRNAILATLSKDTKSQIRLFAANGTLIADSSQIAEPAFQLRNPSTEAWQRQVALRMDRIIDWIVGADLPPPYLPGTTGLSSPSLSPAIRFAPDRTHMIAAGARVGQDGSYVTTLENARDIRRIVRAERSRLGLIIGVAIALSVLLSLFLARTIVRPLQRLADAAMRVRLGQARDVAVPRLPFRRDEIGTLARALADMTQALRQRIDSTEAFAADVAHEMKNPLASLASAVETLGAISDPALQKQLHDVIRHDVRRLDRLITDISELSRIDAQIARTRFESIDIGTMITELLRFRVDRGQNGDVTIAFARPAKGSTRVMGDAGRLARVIENLLDNAISFSKPGDVVRISATRDGSLIRVCVDDDGPGIPESARESIFERFHSDRPDSHEFGRHSGLGLSIARTIIEAHGGEIRATGREAEKTGARLEFNLPATEIPKR